MVFSFVCKKNDDVIASLIRKQIADLTVILHDLEAGRTSGDSTQDSLTRIEQQIRWLRKVGLE